MLQIATGKFFKHEVGQVNLLRGVLHTNYRASFRDHGLETSAGKLVPSSHSRGLKSLIYEVFERYEGPVRSGSIASIGIEPFLSDMGAIASFGLDITCTPDPDLARRLLGDAPLSPNAHYRPNKYVPRTFETEIWGTVQEAENFRIFANDLIALDRKHYLGAIRAIRTYVTGLQRLGDDFDLAYTLLVASIESLAQGFDGHEATWNDYDETKRKRIEGALKEAPEAIADGVRTALLEIEHVSLARRFKAYALQNLKPSYFRDEAAGRLRPIGKADLSVALEQAYRIRSKYVHTLNAVPRNISYIHDHGEYTTVDRNPVLTIQGLARLARHLIHEFVRNGPTTEKEDYAYNLDIPGIVQMEVAPQYWVWQHEGFQPAWARERLGGFLSMYASVVLQEPDAALVDLRDLSRTMEALIPTAKLMHQLPMLTLYWLYNAVAPSAHSLENWIEFANKYRSIFDAPSLESLVLHIALRQFPNDWTVAQLVDVRQRYMRARYRPKQLRLPRLFEAAIDLTLAEAYRRCGDEVAARAMICDAVENHPTNERLAALEVALSAPLPPIDWDEVLLPPRSEPTPAEKLA